MGCLWKKQACEIELFLDSANGFDGWFPAEYWWLRATINDFRCSPPCSVIFSCSPSFSVFIPRGIPERGGRGPTSFIWSPSSGDRGLNIRRGILVLSTAHWLTLSLMLPTHLRAKTSSARMAVQKRLNKR